MRIDWTEARRISVEEGTFHRMYRMDAAAFDVLVDRLRPWLQVNEVKAENAVEAGAVCIESRVAMALRYLAGALYLDVFTYHGCSRPVFYVSLWMVIDAINDCRDFEVKFPRTEQQCQANAAAFKAGSARGVVDRCVGAVDGLSIKLQASPAKSTLNVQKFYSGHKVCYCLNLQGICDARCRIIGASLNIPGSTNDATAWELPPVRRDVEALPCSYYVVADAACPLSEQMLTPYPRAQLSVYTDSFNFHQSQVRITVERTFGQLVGRFGVLWKPLRVSLEHASQVAKACILLHNFCIEQRVEMMTAAEVDGLEERVDEQGRYRHLAGNAAARGAAAVAAAANGSSVARTLITELLERNEQIRPGY